MRGLGQWRGLLLGGFPLCPQPFYKPQTRLQPFGLLALGGRMAMMPTGNIPTTNVVLLVLLIT